MKTTSELLLAILASAAHAVPFSHVTPTAVDSRAEVRAAAAASPTVYMCGDSTMALGGGGTGTQGWGVYLPYSLKIPVVNDAKAGRSARSYTNENRFGEVIATIKSGDIVIIEFGHNDGGSLTPTDNGRSDCVGAGNETCTTAAGVIVQTYPTYLTNATELMVAKGAHVIISSPTPDNTCETGTCSYTSPRFTGYGEEVVKTVGSKSSFIDHGTYLANQYAVLGASVVNTYYPNDHTHTSPVAANLVAGVFVKGVLCAGSSNPLYSHIKNSTASVVGTCI
ncbi:d85510e3-44a0-432a-9395-338215c8df51 [Sclerotinia trifoliorum]|uniref:D85510e3-44a0-432a-9395-338215c8df51 n=1 Tax=Sclerotinia trifoliorum TaxID=28548 RepID=A0A8H2VZM5_9HELO|nr:d85510e3-44a0-432a-9395-338215c8df51 [Sclerotinia trifoliorum]